MSVLYLGFKGEKAAEERLTFEQEEECFYPPALSAGLVVCRILPGWKSVNTDKQKTFQLPALFGAKHVSLGSELRASGFDWSLTLCKHSLRHCGS